MSQALPIEIPEEAIAAFCRKHHIRRLSLFGSVLREDFTDESDVDVLVEFEEGKGPGYFGLFRIEDELAEMVGRKIDLLTPGSFRPTLLQRVRAEARLVYDAA